MPLSDAALRLKFGSCETMTLPLHGARCRAVSMGHISNTDEGANTLGKLPKHDAGSSHWGILTAREPKKGKFCGREWCSHEESNLKPSDP